MKLDFQYLSGCGWAVGLNDNNAILNSVDVVVEVGVELGKKKLAFSCPMHIPPVAFLHQHS